MTTSGWIAIGGIAAGLFATTIGSTLVLSFKIGAVHEKIINLEERVTSIERTLKYVLKKMRKMEYKVGQMQVRLDVLWANRKSRHR